MPHAAHDDNCVPYGVRMTSARGEPSKPTGVFQHILDAVFQPRYTQVDRELARLVSSSGGKFTDDIEFQIARLSTSSQFNSRG